jgi:hypothetical protein
LLLLGKLKSKPVTNQLRQLLQGKINSLRSQYTEILQHDLFFVCDCLIEEVAIEKELVELVISRLSDVVKNSPFPSQRQKALDYLGKLTQTRQYAAAGRRALIDLVKDTTLGVSTRIDTALTIYTCSPIQSEDRQMATEASNSTNFGYDTRVLPTS